MLINVDQFGAISAPLWRNDRAVWPLRVDAVHSELVNVARGGTRQNGRAKEGHGGEGGGACGQAQMTEIYM